MQSTGGPVWVVAEQVDCRLLDVSLQLTGKARQLADQLGVAVEAVFIGDIVTPTRNVETVK